MVKSEDSVELGQMCWPISLSSVSTRHKVLRSSINRLPVTLYPADVSLDLIHCQTKTGFSPCELNIACLYYKYIIF